MHFAVLFWIIFFILIVFEKQMSDTVVVQFSSPSTAFIHSVSSNSGSLSGDINDYEIKAETNSDLPFLFEKKTYSI